MRYLFMLLLMTSFCVHAAEIDCKNPKTSQDKMICENNELMAADTTLAKTYGSIVEKLKKL